jgi:hypothetical protein
VRHASRPAALHITNGPLRLHVRLEQLIKWHEDTLVRLHQQLSEPQRAVDVFSILFHRHVSAELLTMATGESLAHLNCLIRRGLAAKQIDDSGVCWYRSL